MNSSFDKQLAKLLKDGSTDSAIEGLPDEEEDTTPPPEMLPVRYDNKETSLQIDNQDLQDDYEFARSNLYGLIGKSNAALELALQIGQMSEHPRALEVAANLMKTSSDMAKELMQLHKSLDGKNKSKEEGKYTQVNNYYGDQKSAETTIDNLPDEDPKDDS